MGGFALDVSVVIPTYNRCECVTRAIDSVLDQTMAVSEIVVVDDGSTDGTAEAVRSRYGTRVRLIIQKNTGVSAARNRGVRATCGDWIAFLDSDDVWLPAKIDRQLEAVKDLGPRCGLCFTECVFEGDPASSGSAFEGSGLVGLRGFGLFDKARDYFVGARGPIRMQSVMVLRSLLQELGGFDDALTIMEDMDLLFRLTFKTEFCFVAEPLVRIDRAPSRTDRLCNLFAARNDRVYEDFARIYVRWLAMPEVAGTEYEQSIREMLRLLLYDSTECKLHRLRLGAALRELGRLRALGDGLGVVAATLISRKLEKLRRRALAIEPPDRVRGTLAS